jgi:hypothetical protein
MLQRITNFKGKFVPCCNDGKEFVTAWVDERTDEEADAGRMTQLRQIQTNQALAGKPLQTACSDFTA